MGICIADITLEKLLPSRGESTYSSGLELKDEGFVKYGPKSSTQPTLQIIEPIYDEDRNVILPGYYELALSYDRNFMSLVQSGKEIATFPVFKIEEDKSQLDEPPRDKKSLRKYNKEQKKKEKKRKKLIKEKKIPEDPIIYTNASMEYSVKGDYYLIKYEKEHIRAWGALKF